MNALQGGLEKFLVTASLIRGRIRGKLLALRGATISQKVFIGSRCRVNRPWCVTLGKRFTAEDSVYMKVVANNAILQFGDYVFVGRGSEFDVLEKISVGDHTVIAPGCFVTDHNHGISGDLRIDQQPGSAKPVKIGRDVWLGANVAILAGVEIGDGAVVGANAVVTRDVPTMAIVAGVPANVLRYRDVKRSRSSA